MKTCIDMYAGLLGSGKTTLISRLLETEYKGRKTAIIENEIGIVNLDAAAFEESDVTISELTNGCVCCTIKGEFTKCVDKIAETVHPEFILIEPTGAADVAGIIDACKDCRSVVFRRMVMIVNAKKLCSLLKIVGPFYEEQIKSASCIFLNFAERLDPEKLQITRETIKEINPLAVMIDTPMAEVNENTFAGKADFLTEGNESEIQNKGSRSSLKVIEAKSAVHKKISFGREKDIQLYTWTLDITKPLTEAEYEKLKNLLLDPKTGEIWRAKGIVPMADGENRRIDLTFGEVFEKEQMTADEDIVGKIVLIGKSLEKITI